MELTKREIGIADRHLSKRERQLAQWPRNRWVMLIIFSVFALVGYLNIRSGEQSIQDDKATDMQVSQALEKTPPPGLEHQWAVGSMLKVSKILELRHQIVTSALTQIVIGYVMLISNIGMMVLIIVRWNTGERDALICKLLRGKLHEFEQVNRANSNTAPSPSSS